MCGQLSSRLAKSENQPTASQDTKTSAEAKYR